MLLSLCYIGAEATAIKGCTTVSANDIHPTKQYVQHGGYITDNFDHSFSTGKLLNVMISHTYLQTIPLSYTGIFKRSPIVNTLKTALDILLPTKLKTAYAPMRNLF